MNKQATILLTIVLYCGVAFAAAPVTIAQLPLMSPAQWQSLQEAEQNSSAMQMTNPLRKSEYRLDELRQRRELPEDSRVFLVREKSSSANLDRVSGFAAAADSVLDADQSVAVNGEHDTVFVDLPSSAQVVTDQNLRPRYPMGTQTTGNDFEPGRSTQREVPNNYQESFPSGSGTRETVPRMSDNQERLEENQFGASSNSENVIWWTEAVNQPIAEQFSSSAVHPGQLLQLSLAASPKIKSISQNPLIRELQVIEADAEFDPVVFTRNLFEDRTDPVGNTLTTGGADFLEDHIFTSDTGLRRRTRTGADVTLSQRLGFQNSNSTFFQPQDQGTATLAINVSQPLLRGGGRYYNQIQIMIAQTAGGVAWDELAMELQDELRAVLVAYWQLYLDRASFFQRRESLARGERILNLLKNRASLDSLPSQIARARSAVESRRTAMTNALRDIKNTETEIRRLVGDRQGMTNELGELLPSANPEVIDLQLKQEDVIQTALENRPEIRESMKRVRIAALQTDMSSNELLPSLSLLMGAYVSGLEGGSGVERAFVEQFSNTTPGYSLGFDFELPYRNRAAKSRLTQRQLLLKQVQQNLEENVLNVVAESQITYRSLITALATLRTSKISIEAASQDLSQQVRRFETFALIEGDLVEGQSPTVMLNQLLDAQDRLLTAEGVYSRTMFDLQVAYIALSRATGTLLQHSNVTWAVNTGFNGPDIQFDTNDGQANQRHPIPNDNAMGFAGQ